MADIKQLITLTIVANTEPIKEVGKAAKETASEIDKLNQATKASISTYEQALNNIQRNMAVTLDNIKNIKSDIEQSNIILQRIQNEIELNKNIIRTRMSQKDRAVLEDLGSILLTPIGGISGKQLVDIVINLDISDEARMFIAKNQLFLDSERKKTLERALETNEMSPTRGSKMKQLTPEDRAAIEKELVDLEKRAFDLKEFIARLQESDLLKEDPVAFEINSLMDSIQKSEQILEQQENIKKKQESNLKDTQSTFNQLVNDYQDTIKKLQELGVEIPDTELKLEFNEVIPEGLQNKLEEHKDTIKDYHAELETGNKVVTEYEGSFKHLEGAIAMAGQGLVAGAGAQSEFAQSTKGTVNQLKNESERITNLDPNLQSLAKRNNDVAQTQEQVNQVVGESGVVYDGASKSVEAYGDTVEEVQNKGGFFEGIKQGFIDFVENVQSNSELMADFFADTLSQMSQSFSDLFFNIITGKFDDLKDLAKQAFEAILRAFLDLVSAIVTKQIVISIAGVFGFGKGAGAGDLLGFGKQAAGIGADLAGIFGGGGGAAGGTAIAGGATSLGTGTVAIGSGLGGISSVGTGAATVGATSVLDVSAAGGALGGINAVVPEAGGFLASIGGVAGAITIVGAVLAAAALAFTFLAPLFKKTPRLDIDFDSVKTEAGRRAALVSELLDDDFLKDEIIDISVKRKAGLGLGGDEGIKDVLADAIQVAVNNLLDIINKLPTDLAETLSEELLNTPLDTEAEVAGERLFEFDAKGKKIAEKFNQLINGEIQAKFLFAVDGFLQTMFESLGVLPEAAEAFLDERFEEFKNAGSREARAKVGQELLADINAFVDAFNIVSGNVNDSIGQTIQSINSLSRKLGFDAVPSIGELTDKLGELIQNAELDAETVQMYADLRNAIVQGISDIINSITGLIGKISQLNSTIVGLGGAAVNIIPFLDQAQAALLDFYTTNIDNLSLGEQESFLDQILGVANAKLAEEQAAFQRAQEARQRAEEAQRERIQKRIDSLNKEKDKINEVFQKRIEALNEELQIAESFAQLTESIRQTLDSILFSPESVLTGVEQVNALKSNIANLQAQLTSAVDPEKQLEIAGRLEEAFKTLFDTAGDAFGVNSPEFVAIFDQVTGGLEGLAGFTEGQGRSVEEISAEIERITAVNEATLKSIDAKIEAAQERLANIGQSTADNTFHASQELTELFEFIRNEYIRILEERFAELGEISEFGFATETEGLSVIAGLTDESLTVLKGVGEETAKQTGYLADIAGRLGALAGFQRGSEGFRDFGRGTLAVLHGFEAVVTKRDIAAVQESILHQIAGAGVSGLADRLAGEGNGRDGLSRGGFIAGMRPGGGFVPEFPLSGVRPSPDEPVNHVTEMSVDINVNVNGGSQASIASLAGEIENMMVRSIRQGRVRKELQEAAVRRVG